MNPARIQYVAILFCLILLVFLVRLILKRKLREEYIVVWLFALIGFLFIALFRNEMDVLAKWLGVFYSPSLLFMVFMAAVLMYSLHLSIVSSKMHWNIKHLTARLAIMQQELEELKKQFKKD